MNSKIWMMVVVLVGVLGAATGRAASVACNAQCLEGVMGRYLAQLLKHDPAPLPKAAGIIAIENAKPAPLGTGSWQTIRAYPVPGQTFADSVNGQVVHYTATTNTDGKTGSLYVRLKVVDGKITESEIFSRGSYLSEGQQTSGLLEPDVLYTAAVPEARRSTRQELAKVVDLYMDAIQQHRGTVVPVSTRCDRYQAGNKFTNVVENFNRGGGTCQSSMDNLKGQGAVNRRFPVLDVERGIAIVHFIIEHAERDPKNATNVAEIFKIVDRKVRSIEEFSFIGAWPTSSGFADEPAPVLPLVAAGAVPKQVATGFGFTEGPATDLAGNVWFSDIPNSRIHKWDMATGKVSVHRENTGRANGLMFDAQGRLVVCEMGNSKLSLDDLKGSVTTLAAGREGEPLHMPNDLWIDAAGGVYFSDFTTPIATGPADLQVYYQPPGGKPLQRATNDLSMPNGLAGSLDGRQLYVTDLRARKTWVYNVGANGTLSDRKLFADDYADGLKLDEYGNVYLVGEAPRESVRIYSPAGVKLQQIALPGIVSNLSFGGKDGKTLFLTAGQAIYALQMNVRGAPTPLERAHGRFR